MVWLQAGVCFVIWVAYGLWLRRSSERLRARFCTMGRTSRTLLGSVGLVGGLGVLAGGLYLVSRGGGLGTSGLEPWAWATVALLGLGFVHLQVLGAAAMVSLVLEEVTDRPDGPSVRKEQEQS
jgi:hypothetical protein